MEINTESFLSMLSTQQKVNEKVGEKTKWKPDTLDYITAFEVEKHEFINAVGLFKWWKHSHVLKKDRIIDELADCFAFYLSAILTQPESIEDTGETKHPQLDSMRMTLNRYDIVMGMCPITESEDKRYECIRMIIKSMLSNGETSQPKIGVVLSMAFCMVIFTYSFPEATWEEVLAAYNTKSEINIKRQETNY